MTPLNCDTPPVTRMDELDAEQTMGNALFLLTFMNPEDTDPQPFLALGRDEDEATDICCETHPEAVIFGSLNALPLDPMAAVALSTVLPIHRSL